MAFDFSTLITDRSPEDLKALRDLLATPMSDWTAEQLAQFNQAVSKGAYNYTDLNRVTACMDYLNERLTAAGYETGYHPIIVHPEPPEPVGPLPEGYTELEYIESTGTQYVDTGVNPNQDTGVILDYEPTVSGTFAVFGARVNVGNSAFALWITGETSIEDDYGTDRSAVSVSSILQQTHVEKIQNGLTYGATQYTHSAATFASQYSLAIFGLNSGGTVDTRRVSAKLYACEIYAGDTPVRLFVPCKNPSGEVGLYDTVTEQFYGNAGTGAFIAGPEMGYDPSPPPTPVLDPYTWYEDDIPTETPVAAYLANVEALRGVIALPEDTPEVPTDMEGLTLAEANAIEEVLDYIHVYLTALSLVFRRCGPAICGGPGFYFAN